MPTPVLRTLMIDEFLGWDSGDDRLYELVEGVPVAMSAPSRAHQIIAVNFGRRPSRASMPSRGKRSSIFERHTGR